MENLEQTERFESFSHPIFFHGSLTRVTMGCASVAEAYLNDDNVVVVAVFSIGSCSHQAASRGNVGMLGESRHALAEETARISEWEEVAYELRRMLLHVGDWVSPGGDYGAIFSQALW